MVERADNTDLVILSGAYIGDEMAAEFGSIPPSFLPLGGRRLFEHQAKLSKGNVYISLPEDFDVPKVDQTRIDALSLKVVRVPKELSLRNSMQRVLRSLDLANGVEILFGDTLIYGPCPDSKDLASFQNDPAHHYWSYFSDENPIKPFVAGLGDGINERRILCGHFRFSVSHALVDALEKATDFVEALNLYDAQIPFKKCMVETWFDFGHLSLYYQSKRNFSVARAFNSIEADGKTVRKSSAQTNKIRAEAGWYKNLPTELKLFTPKYLGMDDRDYLAGYRMEYVYQPLLSDLSVFGKLPGNVWSQILGSCFEFLKIARQEKPQPGSPETARQFSDDFFNYMYAEKTRNRLAAYLKAQNIQPDTCYSLNGHKLPPVKEIVDLLLANIRPTEPADISFLHGDFFFGNTFFDFRSTNVTVIDPRAMLAGGAPSLFGDHRYDVAKLSHSIVGAYDHIINARSCLTKPTSFDWQFSPTDIQLPDGLEALMFETALKTFGIGRIELLSMTALLFFSMLPLHSDSTERQEHLFANALRLSICALELP